MKYIVENVRVVSVEEKFDNAAATQGADGKWSVPRVSLGWFVRITESSTIGLGPEKPDIVAGDLVRLTLEKQ